MRGRLPLGPLSLEGRAVSFGNWLKNATRVRLDSHTAGNLVRNAGIVGGAVLGGVPGALVAGGTSALRAAARPGANFGDIVGAGLGDAGTATALHGGAGILKNALGGGVPSAGIPSATGAPVVSASQGFPPVPSDAVPLSGASVASTVPKPSGGFSLGNAAKGVGGFIEHHPKLTEAGLSAFGSLGTMD